MGLRGRAKKGEGLKREEQKKRVGLRKRQG